MSDIAAPAAEGEMMGHPHDLATVFFTEMWERFSDYGMRALLVVGLALFGVIRFNAFSLATVMTCVIVSVAAICFFQGSPI